MSIEGAGTESISGGESPELTADTGGADEGGADDGGAGEQQATQSQGPSRVRARHWEKLNTELASTKELLTKQQQTWQQEMARRDAELAELKGYLKAQAEARQAERNAEPAGPSASDLVKEAKKALDANDLDTYHEKMLAASEARSVEKMRALMPKQQPAQPQGQMDPVVQGMYLTYAQQVQDPQRLMQLAVLEDQRMHVMGIQPGYERYRMAFEAASKGLSGDKKQTPTYSQGIAGALAAPASRPAANGQSAGEGDKPLSPEERVWAEAMGGEKEYRKYMRGVK